MAQRAINPEHRVLAVIPLLLLPVFVHVVLAFAGNNRMQILAVWGPPFLVWSSLFAVVGFAVIRRGSGFLRWTAIAMAAATASLAILDGIDIVETPW